MIQVHERGQFTGFVMYFLMEIRDSGVWTHGKDCINFSSIVYLNKCKLSVTIEDPGLQIKLPISMFWVVWDNLMNDFASIDY